MSGQIVNGWRPFVVRANDPPGKKMVGGFERDGAAVVRGGQSAAVWVSYPRMKQLVCENPGVPPIPGQPDASPFMNLLNSLIIGREAGDNRAFPIVKLDVDMFILTMIGDLAHRARKAVVKAANWRGVDLDAFWPHRKNRCARD